MRQKTVMASVRVLLSGWLVCSWAALLWLADSPVGGQQPADVVTVAQQSEPTEHNSENKKSRSSVGDFNRIRRNERGRALALETAIVRYQCAAPNGDLVHVDLVAAIHVGERSYYEELNRRFKSYDAVLFELVAPEDFRVPEGARLDSQSGIGFLQKALQNVLGLEYQLYGVDYSQKNFVHADLSPEQIAQLMQERGESFLLILWRLLQHAMEKEAKERESKQRSRSKRLSDWELLLALLRQDRVVLKRALAEEMTGFDDALAAISSKDGSSTIITERNKKAIEVLRRQIQQGKRKFAIFYGAAHMPDLEARLFEEFRAERLSQEWLLAWDLTADHSRAPNGKR